MSPAARARIARRGEWQLTAPSFLWLLVFFAIPTLLIFVVSFRPTDRFGGIGAGWSAAAWRALAHPAYPAILWRTFRLSAATTVVALLLAVPMGYAMARAPRRLRSVLVLLVVLPFWTSFLIRVFAWRSLLHPQGPVARLLTSFGLTRPDTLLLYNEPSVLLVMIYTYLPFAILPVYAAAEKFDFQLVEAARDLGAGPVQAFCLVFLPGIRRALESAVLMVFIPAVGSYVIPDLVGGPTSEMIGNKIAQRAFADRNLPEAAALSAVLTLAMLLPVIVVFLQRRRAALREAARPWEAP